MLLFVCEQPLRNNCYRIAKSRYAKIRSIYHQLIDNGTRLVVDGFACLTILPAKHPCRLLLNRVLFYNSISSRSEYVLSHAISSIKLLLEWGMQHPATNLDIGLDIDLSSK